MGAETFNGIPTKTLSKLYVGRSRSSFDPPGRPHYYSSTEPPPTHNHKHSSQTIISLWNAPETKRKKRVAQYKLYGIEGKVKCSLKKGFRWIKKTCSRIVHGL
ncbi:hypothetical protein P3X46_005544 [Hevea brasiliensis]|uniref:DUF3511 domain-containing protein n=1 Tax=Hevea brasiliensis TaxID=3981 RepID=A0ABQ9N569_HEVBR|nr:hypothetical protein P3X46_005544 [Hevea brasiliensis]